ncbi:MAG: sugar ABC transporter permease [Chloroflexi bacterium]|nr:sugar ABC transporter permease [Chloroflexota bacterium]
MLLQKRRLSMRTQEALTCYLFLLPWAIGFLAFVIGPVIASFVLSFMDYSVVTPPRFAGLSNYTVLFGEDTRFGLSMGNTLYYVGMYVPLHLLVAIALALFLNQQVRGMPAYRTLFYIPSIVPLVAGAILWVWILQPEWGLINSLLNLLGIEGPLWLASTEWSKPALIVMALWGSGSAMIIFLAGLQGVPQHLYEAAEIDGANRWQRFVNVTLPMLSPTIFFLLVLSVIGSFQVFTTAYVMTGGGPAESTLFYMLYLYRRAFVFLNMGYAAAMAWILFLGILALTLVQFTLANRWVYYEAERR